MWLIVGQNQWRPPVKRVLLAKERMRRRQDHILKRPRLGKRRCTNCSRMIWVNGNRAAPWKIPALLHGRSRKILLRANQGMQQCFLLGSVFISIEVEKKRWKMTCFSASYRVKQIRSICQWCKTLGTPAFLILSMGFFFLAGTIAESRPVNM